MSWKEEKSTTAMKTSSIQFWSYLKFIFKEKQNGFLGFPIISFRSRDIHIKTTVWDNPITYM